MQREIRVCDHRTTRKKSIQGPSEGCPVPGRISTDPRRYPDDRICDRRTGSVPDRSHRHRSAGVFQSQNPRMDRIVPAAGWIAACGFDHPSNHPQPSGNILLPGKSPGWSFLSGFARTVIATALVSSLLLTGHANLIASPERLEPQELVASILGFGMIMILVGLFEETVFRGLLQCEWAFGRKSWIPAISVSGLLFGWMHTINFDADNQLLLLVHLNGHIALWVRHAGKNVLLYELGPLLALIEEVCVTLVSRS